MSSSVKKARLFSTLGESRAAIYSHPGHAGHDSTIDFNVNGDLEIGAK